jgi:cytochrome c-type biogenesis protein CcmH
MEIRIKKKAQQQSGRSCRSGMHPGQWLLIIFTAACLAGWIHQAAAAQSAIATPSEDEVNAVARQLYCPVCENIPLDVCGTTACAQWRDLIREKLEAGWTVDQINNYFATQYGDRVLAQPPRRGLNWLIYIIPPAAVLIGAYILYRVLNHMRKPAPVTPSTPQPGTSETDAYIRRIESELRQDGRK